MSKDGIQFYHSRPLAYSYPNNIKQRPDPEDPYFEAAYQWLSDAIGFYGVFLAVGGSEAIEMTSYANQYSRRWSDATSLERRNQVLFGYANLHEARFSDYNNWHIILNSVGNDIVEPHQNRHAAVSDYVKRLVLKPSWSYRDWLRAAHRCEVTVQAHIPSLDLAAADIIYCRNQATQAELVKRGFTNPEPIVKRLKPPNYL